MDQSHENVLEAGVAVGRLGLRAAGVGGLGHDDYYVGKHKVDGRSGQQGFGCDDTRGPADDVRPTVAVIPSAPEAAVADLPDLSGWQVYACGAPIVVESAKRDFVAACGLPEDEFYADAFTTEADLAQP